MPFHHAPGLLALEGLLGFSFPFYPFYPYNKEYDNGIRGMHLQVAAQARMRDAAWNASEYRTEWHERVQRRNAIIVVMTVVMTVLMTVVMTVVMIVVM